MSTAARVSGYLLVLAFLFAAAFGVGRLVGPVGAADTGHEPPATPAASAPGAGSH